MGYDGGWWHCVTGFLSEGCDPQDQALAELGEETGLTRPDMESLLQGPTLEIPDRNANLWTVHTFSCHVKKTGLTLNWEHDRYLWLTRTELSRVALVPWFFDVLQAVDHWTGPPVTSSRADVPVRAEPSSDGNDAAS